ncbi:neurotrophin 1-like isoform X1 [Macrobrachium rosenbergii]|uniref:neurotrophin 1-like isoform X1 n=1 Tax=Macrobrachium rosenbergii TaxID=79674 RepID=UPI0034D5CF08
MAAKERMLALLTLLLALSVPRAIAADSETTDDMDEGASDTQETTILSPAEELLEAARKAGYNLTLERLDEAAAATDEEVSEMMPQPVAEAFIGHRRRDNVDLIREQMIGMIFTGTPQALGPRQRRPPPPPPRHRPRPRVPYNPTGRLSVQYNPQGEDSIQHTRKVPAPENILKPLPFVPGPTMVKFPTIPKPPSRQAPAPRPRPRPPHSENFGNAVGPDFGPVTFSHVSTSSGGFNNNFDNDFKNFGPTKDDFGPPKTPQRFPPRPPPPSHQGRPTGGFAGHDGGCVKYTEDICLDSFEYPHEAILSSLIRDPSRSDTMMAEVRSQSADDLVDGVTSSQESKYDYQHYFGNRRAGTENHAHRDFAHDGGYLCPSEVKYARPKRARNSKGRWKYIVNLDKYSQTIRMEKCMKPGGACSYVSHHYRATCNQVYNYHRLLSWEDGRGLHMDIFKVPSCCSCHIQGYAYVFPPLNRRQHTAGSVQVSQTVPAPQPDPNDLAPGSDPSEKAYSPVNYPNIPVKQPPRRRRPVQSSRPGVRRPGPGLDNNYRNATTQSINRSDLGPLPDETASYEDPDRNGPVNWDHQGSEEDRVNYGYHPIIDFFNPYSFDSQRQR